MFNASARARQMAAGEPNPIGTRWISTNLTESDVVMGGEKKLEAAILEADEHYRPAALIVMASCVPGLIGDDIDSVTARMPYRSAWLDGSSPFRYINEPVDSLEPAVALSR